MDSFDSESASVKQAASSALGRLPVGDCQKFLPILLKLITKSQDTKQHQSLLLSALKIALVFHSQTKVQMARFTTDLSSVTPILLNYAKTTDDSVRDTVSQCLGESISAQHNSSCTKISRWSPTCICIYPLLIIHSPFTLPAVVGRLSIIDAVTILPKLKELAMSKDANERWAAVVAFRTGFDDFTDWEVLKEYLDDLCVRLLKDEDLKVFAPTLFARGSVLEQKEKA